MKRMIRFFLICLSICFVFSLSVAEEIDLTQYNIDDLITLRDVIDQRIYELRIQDAIENGDRKIEFPEEEFVIYNGIQKTITPTITRRIDTAPKSTVLVWSSSDPEILAVSNGVIKGITAGDAIITATAKDNEFISGSVTVHVRNTVTSVTLNETTINLLLGDTEEKSKGQLLPQVLPENAFDKSLTWTSSDENVVKVNEHGELQAISAGKAVITVTANDESLKTPKTAKCTVTVGQAVTEISAYPILTLGKQKTHKIEVTVKPENATNKTIKFTSSDPSIVSVSQNGTLTANACGKCQITCETTDGSQKVANVHVTVIQQVTGLSFSATSINVKNVENYVTEYSVIAYVPISIQPKDATNKKLSFSSSDSSIAEVGEMKDGKLNIRCYNSGDCTITVKTTDGSDKTASIRVHVPAAFFEKKEYTVTDKKGMSIPVTFMVSTLTLQENSTYLFDAEWVNNKIYIIPKKAGKGSVSVYSKNNPNEKITVTVIIDSNAVYDKNSYPVGYYSNVLRSPNSYINKKMQIYGKILQKQESGSYTILRVGTSGYGLYDDVFYVTYKTSDIKAKVIEDDKVTIYGTCTGTKTYTTVLGASKTLPALEAENIVFGKVQ